MKLNELAPEIGARKARKRVGRGVASGWGKTAGRGSKGLKARSGGSVRPGFEGGQMPIHRRLPKRGFTNIFKKEYAFLNIRELKRFEKDTVIDEPLLVKTGIIKGKRDGIKLLGHGEIDFPVTVKVDKATKSAIEKVEKAGGKVILTDVKAEESEKVEVS